MICSYNYIDQRNGAKWILKYCLTPIEINYFCFIRPFYKTFILYQSVICDLLPCDNYNIIITDSEGWIKLGFLRSSIKAFK